MVLFILALGLLCLYGISFYDVAKRKTNDTSGYFKDYMSIEKTNSVKGIFIIIVLLSHATSYITLSGALTDRLYDYFLHYFLNQSMVSMFLFCSGFGIMLSIDKKGSAYINGIPKKRLGKVLLHFDIAVLLFAGMQAILGRFFSAKTILLSLTGWESLGNSNWYIFVILCLYLITFIAYALAKEKRYIGLAVTVVLCGGLIAILYCFKELFWYDTLLCYPLGMLFYLLKGKLEAVLFKNKINYYLCTGLAVMLFGVSLVFRTSAPGAIVKSLLFSIVFVLITMKVSINNKILQFFGKHLFSIYILQRIPMIILSHFGLNDNKYIFTLVSIVITVPLAVGFDFLLGRLDGILFKTKT